MHLTSLTEYPDDEEERRMTRSYFRRVLDRLAEMLGYKAQAEAPSETTLDLYDRCGISIADTISKSLVPMITQDFDWQVRGESYRAAYLDALTTRFVNGKLDKAVQTALNTGECLAVPRFTTSTRLLGARGDVTTYLVDANGYRILRCEDDTLLDIVIALDVYRTTHREYILLERIRYDADLRECFYSLYVAVDGRISRDIGMIDQWADYELDWSVRGVDKILVARLKAPFVDPKNINNIKGIPLCAGADYAIRGLKEIYDQTGFEFEAKEPMIFLDDQLLMDDNGAVRVPRGRQRYINPVRITGESAEDMVREYSPEIRSGSYQEGISIYNRLIEQNIGVNRGILSENDSQYENVDNVRRGNQRTWALIESIRTAADEFLYQMMYCYEVICEVERVTPYGTYEVYHKWSSEYKESKGDQMQVLLSGINVGAISSAEYRQFVTGESIEECRRAVDEIKRQSEERTIGAIVESAMEAVDAMADEAAAREEREREEER